MSVLAGRAVLRRGLVVVTQLLAAVAVYALAALARRDLAHGHGRPGIATVLVATAVVGTVLALIRRPVERLVNWLAFGQRADSYELAAGFLKRLASSLEVDDVIPRLAETVARTVGSRRGEVHVWLADGGTWRQTWPLDAAVGAADVSVPVRHGDDPVGEMVVGVDASDLSVADRRLLQQLAGPAGVALSTVRLTHALRQQAAEIEATSADIRASRQRIVTARQDEQARIRHRLDSRVQPHLAAARAALLTVGPVGPVDQTTLDRAGAGVSRALDELRGLARGIFPARLADAGVIEALRGWAEQSDGSVRVDLPAADDPHRLDPAIGAALYFCAVTAARRSAAWFQPHRPPHR